MTTFEGDAVKCNVGGVDRGARIVLGVLLLGIVLFIAMSPIWQTVLAVLGVVALVTGAIRYCPLNALLGVDSCRGKPVQ
jgi:hydrogenase/urease accessory protein HupE